MIIEYDKGQITFRTYTHYVVKSEKVNCQSVRRLVEIIFNNDIRLRIQFRNIDIIHIIEI